MWRDEEIFNTPGIYHNETEGLISLSSDGESWITIADKNLGAAQVWNEWDELTEANCGKFYQRWNNYGFPRKWEVTTSSTKVDASAYWPDNYYSSDVFIESTTNWDSTNNANLWWWLETALEAKQWPAQTWFHIPTAAELSGIYNMRVSLWLGSEDGTLFGSIFKMPFAGYFSETSPENRAFYWSSNMQYDDIECIYFWITSTSIISSLETSYSSRGYSIRPFKNEPVVPTSERTVLYQPN